MTKDELVQHDQAIADLHGAQRLVAELQRPYRPETWASGQMMTVDVRDLWHALESIDDRIHDALGKLGD